jgi:hypothetical protein
MVYPRYSQMFGSLKVVRDSLEQSYFARQHDVEAKAQTLLAENPDKAVKYLNDYSVEVAQQMLARWRQLATYLIVKYNDMIVKPEENGQFKATPSGIGARVARPGYPETFRKRLVQQTGDKFKVPE